MAQKTLSSIRDATKGLRSINERQFMAAYKKSLQFYLDKLIIRHFIKGYAKRQGWTPNDPSYQAFKKKHYGDLPQLVLRGTLKKDAQRGRINRRGKGLVIRWRGKAARNYGVIQRRLGRDWSSPSKRDNRDIMRKLKSEFKALRAKSGAKVRR